MKAVVIAFDRLSSWLLGCYGNGEICTPSFDRLAAESVVFDQHFGENFDSTAFNHAWWTGRYQFRLTPEQQAACPHVIDLLRANGVETWLIRESSGKDIVPGQTEFDHSVEFDTISDDDEFGCRCRNAIDEWASDNQTAGLLWLQSPGLTPLGRGRPVADGLGGAEPGESLLSVSERKNSVETLDRRLGTVLEILDGTAIEDLLTIVTAASGSLVGDRSDFLSGERFLTEEQIHTPLLIRESDGGSRRQSLVQTIDLPPTLLDWFGAADRLPRCDGNSLLPLLRGESTGIHEWLFLGDGAGHAAIRTSSWYLIVESQDSERLFAKPDDVWDILDVAVQAPQETARLKERLENFVMKSGPVPN